MNIRPLLPICLLLGGSTLSYSRPLLAQYWPFTEQRQRPGATWIDQPINGQITRPQLQRINQAGQGQDSDGYFRRQIPTSELQDLPLSPGPNRLQLQWDPDRSIILQTQDGTVRRMDYVLPR